MMRIVLCPNPFRDKGLVTAQEAARVFGELGVETTYCFPFAVDRSTLGKSDPDVPVEELKDALPGADFLICFGGDGTMLHAAKDASIFGVPVLGVNMGSFGFMAEVEREDLAALARLVRGEFVMENRMLLEAKVIREGRVLFRSAALNDAVITKGAVARVIDLNVYLDQTMIFEMYGDGIIVATPTGSTAYSLSAGGPIVEPTAESMIITPINAHMLQPKAMVLDKSRVISVIVPKESRKTAYLSVDGGKAFKLLSGDTVEISRARRHLRLVKFTQQNFYQIVDQKLKRRTRS